MYVPAGDGGEALWIDATAQYFKAGSLPYADEGRMALVIAPGTTGLLRTPVPKPEDSGLVETRVFTLSQLGSAHVEEVSETTGDVDASYRELYGGTDTKKIRADLESYMQRAYAAKTLTKIEHGPAEDLTKPFGLTLEIDGAMRGDVLELEKREFVGCTSTRRVQAHEFDDHTYIDPSATYVLAQARMKALGR